MPIRAALTIAKVSRHHSIAGARQGRMTRVLGLDGPQCCWVFIRAHGGRIRSPKEGPLPQGLEG
jgi:hypothetical protein